MGLMKDINPEVLTHLEQLAYRNGKDDGSYLKDLIKAWHKKEKTFMKQVKSFHMTIESGIPKDEARAFVLLTYSGSIIGAGPATDGNARQVIYASVGQRREVPEKLMEDKMSLKKDVILDKEAEFEGGSLKKSSPIYKIALMNDAPSLSQTKQIEDATKIMTREFVSINNTIVPD